MNLLYIFGFWIMMATVHASASVECLGSKVDSVPRPAVSVSNTPQTKVSKDPKRAQYNEGFYALKEPIPRFLTLVEMLKETQISDKDAKE